MEYQSSSGLSRNLNEHRAIQFVDADGKTETLLKGSWFTNGFQGTMCELLCAIEEDREPSNNARQNLRGLELCFAAIQSADSGHVVKMK